MHKKDLYHERIEERFQRPRVHDNSRSPRSSPSDRDSRMPEPRRNKGKGKGEGQALMEIDEENSARQRDLTSGGADEDEVSDREEAVAPIGNSTKVETPPEQEPTQMSPHNDGEDVEPTPQLERDLEDTDMTSGLPEVDV